MKNDKNTKNDKKIATKEVQDWAEKRAKKLKTTRNTIIGIIAS